MQMNNTNNQRTGPPFLSNQTYLTLIEDIHVPSNSDPDQLDKQVK